MNCPFDKEKLSAFYDGELAAAEKAEVERHIASCSECLRDLGELKSAALLIKELPRLRAPKSIAEGVSREIQAAGKVHVLSKFRRTVLWASAAAAGLFVVVNAMYLTGARREAPPELAVRPSASPMAKVVAPAESGPSKDQANEMESDRALARDKEARGQAEPEKKSVEGGVRRDAKPFEEAKKLEAAPSRPADKFGDAKPGDTLAKDAAPAAPTPAPATAAPAPAPVAPVAEPKPAAAPSALPAKPSPEAAPAARKELAEAAAKADVEKAKVAVVQPLPPAQFNVVTTQIAKSRPRIEESLRKMGVPLPAQTRAARNRETENTLVLDLTDAQLVALRDELEKSNDARLVAAPAAQGAVDPVLPGFKSGGMFAKKEAASGGKAASAPPPAPPAKERELKDGKDADEAKPAEAPVEPKRRVTLHFVESRTLPAADAEPARKN